MISGDVDYAETLTPALGILRCVLMKVMAVMTSLSSDNYIFMSSLSVIIAADLATYQISC